MLSPYVGFEALAVLTAALCAIHAYRISDLPFFVTAVGYGIVLEKLVVVGLQNYTYPADRFLDVFGIPLAIGLGWSVVLYAGYDAARRMRLSSPSRAAFVALFVLHVDLALDAVAIRVVPVGYWTWLQAGAYFGVPIGNFFGWFAVGFLFVLVYDDVSDRFDTEWVTGPVTLVVASGLIYAAMVAFEAVTGPILWRKLLVFGVCVALAVLALARAEIEFRTPSPLPAAAVFMTHLYFLGVLFGLGLHRTEPILLAMSLGMLALAASLHVIPAFVTRSTREATSAGSS